MNDMGKVPKGWRFTLPTETQWEYAARGGNKSRGYKYSGSDTADEVAWCDGEFAIGTHPVGKKKANELGLYDMSGNVWEWCLDDWKDDSSELTAEFMRKNDRGGSGRAFRGGCRYYIVGRCRTACRFGNDPGVRDIILGFRLALVSLS